MTRWGERGVWWVCENPEREPDGTERWHWQKNGGPCDPCRIAADAWLRRNPDGVWENYIYRLVNELGNHLTEVVT